MRTQIKQNQFWIITILAVFVLAFSGQEIPAQTDSSCSKESSSRSSESVQAANFSLVNRTKEPLIVYQLDFEGKRQRWFDLAPGKTAKQDTYVDHLWVVTKPNGQCLRIFTAPGEFVIGDTQSPVNTNPPKRPQKQSTPQPSVTTGNADDYVAQGSKYIAAKEYAMAVEAFKKAISLKPSLWNAHFGLGRSYYYLNEFGKALEPLDEAARLKPDQALIHYFVGMNSAKIADGLFDRNDKPSADDKLSGVVFLGKAGEAFEEAIRLRPNESEFYSELGMVSWRMNDHQNAIKSFNTAIRLDPKNIGAHYYLGLTYVKQGKKNEALQIQKKLLTLNEKLAQKLLTEINKMKQRGRQA